MSLISNEDRNRDVWNRVLFIRHYLKFTAASETEFYQCITAVCIVSPVRDGPAQAAIGLRSMLAFLIELGVCPPPRLKAPHLSPVFPLLSSAVEQQIGNRTNKEHRATANHKTTRCW